MTDADHPHWLIVLDATFVVDISHETRRCLVHIHTVCERDKEVDAVTRPPLTSASLLS